MICAGKISDMPPGTARSVKRRKFNIALFNVDGSFYALKENCPHSEVPLVGGLVEKGRVTCPGHCWEFDLKTGDCTAGGVGLSAKTFPVEIRDGSVWIQAD